MATRKPVIGPRRPAYWKRSKGKGAPWEILVLNPHKRTGNPYDQHADDSREACLAWATKRQAEIADGVKTTKGGATLGQLLDALLEGVAANPHRAARTWIAYRTCAKRVPLELREQLAHELRPSDVTDWRSRMLAELDDKSVKQTLSVVAMALDLGIRDDTATGGPMKGKPNIARPPYVPKLVTPKPTVPKACPRADREAIRAQLCGPHRIIVDLCYGAGLRFAEARSVGPRNLNVTGRQLVNVRQWNDYAGGSGEAREPGFADAKSANGNMRTVPIPAWLVEALLEHERLYGLSREGTYAHARTTDAVLEDRGWGKALKAARERAGVAEAWTAHSFRHAFASEHLANGVDMGKLAAWMGDDPITVWRTYVHPVTPESRPEVELPAPVRRESVGKRHLKVV